MNEGIRKGGGGRDRRERKKRIERKMRNIRNRENGIKRWMTTMKRIWIRKRSNKN